MLLEHSNGKLASQEENLLHWFTQLCWSHSQAVPNVSYYTKGINTFNFISMHGHEWL